MTGEPPDLDRAHALMMAALDDECSAAERRELESILEAHAELAGEWLRLRRLKEVTTTMAVRQPPEEVWDRYRAGALHRAERTVAWTLVLFGAAVLTGWGVWHWIQALIGSEAPLVVKVAMVSLATGGILLLGSVIRERWHLHRRDPYSREVIR
jgi:anti-sigma factor RsiW